MSKNNKRKLRLNIKYENGAVVCAKSPGLCKECMESKQCVLTNVFYDPYEGLKETFNNNDRRR